jgi:hypothetical protein
MLDGSGMAMIALAAVSELPGLFFGFTLFLGFGLLSSFSFIIKISGRGMLVVKVVSPFRGLPLLPATW